MRNTRREFIKNTALAGLAMTTLKNIDFMINNKNISFVSPVDGDMLNSYDGTLVNGNLRTKVTVKADKGRNIKINGENTTYGNGYHSAEITLKDYSNYIEAKDAQSGEIQLINVFYLKNVIDRYRLSLDDNIWCLQDISENAGKYRSIFENQYLNFLKQVHDTYGTKVHLNIYYQTDGFNLSQMTDKFRNEWKENSDWLRLSFHALQNDPDRPYINAGYDQVKKDCDLVTEQILRFAGEELTGPVMTLHWGEATREGCRALKDSGYKALAGYFTMNPQDNVSYYLNEDERRHVNNRFIWRDNKEGMIFSRLALVINTLEHDKIVPWLDALRSNSHKPAYIDLMIHEQYFHKHYPSYQPDYRQKVMTSVKWAAENGYKPAFLSECLFS